MEMDEIKPGPIVIELWVTIWLFMLTFFFYLIDLFSEVVGACNQ